MARHRSHLRVLRNRVEVTYSNRLAVPTWHLTGDCKGLEHTPADARTQLVFDNVDDLTRADGRSCRMCALEAVLRTVLSTKHRGRGQGSTDDRSTVTFTSTPALGAVRGDPRPTASGQARVRRLARSLDLVTTHLPGTGVIAYGQVSRRGVASLLGHLHGYVLDDVGGRVEASSIECFWMLAGDRLVEIGDDVDEHARELWSSARLLTR